MNGILKTLTVIHILPFLPGKFLRVPIFDEGRATSPKSSLHCHPEKCFHFATWIDIVEDPLLETVPKEKLKCRLYARVFGLMIRREL